MDQKKILIIEDDNTIRNLLSEHLRRDYEVAQAESGEKGLQFIIDFKPDLVILDMLLPNLDGFALLEQVRNHPDPVIAATKVIVFSNLGEMKDIMRAKVLNVSEYLVKSSTGLDDLTKKIEEILGTA